MKSLDRSTKSAAHPVRDSERDERIEELSAHLYERLHDARDKFSIRAFSEHVGCTDRDLELAKRNLFRTLLEKAWQDGRVVAAERNTLAWVVERLEIPASEAQSIQLSMAKRRFGQVLADAMDDGTVDDDEAERLDEIAQAVGLSLSEFVNSYFLSEGEDFLRGIFAACTEGGFLLENVWDGLVATSQRLGLAKTNLIEAILPQADRFFEHILADAKSDGELSEHEETHVLQLVRTLDLPAESRTYIENSIAALRTIPIPPQLLNHGANASVPRAHILREVRQRIWQRYGGRCAECDAAQCLEFDHIVPIEMGGSNSDANVQLLCRQCILNKTASA